MVYLYLYIGLFPLWLLFLGFVAAKENLDLVDHKIPILFASLFWPVSTVFAACMLLVEYGFKLGGGKK